MTFLLEQGLEIEIGFVTLEEASLLLSIEAEAPALHMSERVQSFDRVADCTGRRGSRGGKSQGPRQRSGAGSLDDVQAHILTVSSRHSLSLVSWTVLSDFMWTR